MDSYLSKQLATPTSQSEPLREDQVRNSAGGFVWELDPFARLRRFLILGTEGGSYYASERKLTLEAVGAVKECLALDPVRTVGEITIVSDEGRAPKNDPAIFALAFAASHQDVAVRRLALASLPVVCRTGTHLFTFLSMVEGGNLRGWGKLLKTAVGDWYNRQKPDDLAYQLMKYRQRGGWTHRDVLRLAHVRPATPEHDVLYGWAVGKAAGGSLPERVDAFMALAEAKTVQEAVPLITEHRLSHEMVPSDLLASPDVWEALLVDMPLTALIRNLGRMTANGLLRPNSEAVKTVVEKLDDPERLRRSRVHPIAVLAALMTYSAGHGARGKLVWDPVGRIIDVLDETFYASFGNVQPSGGAHLLALDVSGSMTYGEVAGVPGLTPRVASAAMALITAAVEEEVDMMAFSTTFRPLAITPRMRLDDVIRTVSGLPFAGTDCALPMLYATQKGIKADAFVVYTDSETWAGRMHPKAALDQYRQGSRIDAKLVVVGMVSNGFTIADPQDAGMLDVVGFDTSAPTVISDFVRGGF